MRVGQLLEVGGERADTTGAVDLMTFLEQATQQARADRGEDADIRHMAGRMTAKKTATKEKTVAKKKTVAKTVTEANDGNHLIGRPHQYTSAMKFADTRVKASDTDGDEKGDVNYGGGIEVFANHADAQARADYIQAIVQASPMFAEYDYVAGSAVIRVSHFLTPTQAAEYKTAGAKL